MCGALCSSRLVHSCEVSDGTGWEHMYQLLHSCLQASLRKPFPQKCHDERKQQTWLLLLLIAFKLAMSAQGECVQLDRYARTQADSPF